VNLLSYFIHDLFALFICGQRLEENWSSQKAVILRMAPNLIACKTICLIDATIGPEIRRLLVLYQTAI